MTLRYIAKRRYPHYVVYFRGSRMNYFRNIFLTTFMAITIMTLFGTQLAIISLYKVEDRLYADGTNLENTTTRIDCDRRLLANEY